MPRILLVCLLAISFKAFADATFQLNYETIPKNLATGLDKYNCKGSLGKPDLLSDIGISDSDVVKGAHCRKADFDSNGSQDYWFYKCDKHLMSCQSDILLMDGNKILKKVHLSHSLENPEVLYSKDKSDHDYLIKFGCSKPTQDALVEEGDGEGKINRIHVLNKAQTDFFESSHCKTVELAD
jgi:hypothetical protein